MIISNEIGELYLTSTRLIFIHKNPFDIFFWSFAHDSCVLSSLSYSILFFSQINVEVCRKMEILQESQVAV